MSNEEAAVQALSIMQSGVTAVVNDDESSSELTDLDRPDAVNASDQDEEMIDSDGSDGNNRSASDADQSDFEEADEADGDEDDEDEDDNDVDSQETEEEDLRGISKETDSKERSSKNGTASDGEDGVNEAEGGSSDTMSHSKNSKSARRKPEYFDPELYGLRRSNRSHVAPDRFVEFDAADESDETPRKSRKAMKRETKTAASSRTQSASSDSDDFGASSRSRKKRRKTSNHVSEMRFSTRNNKVMNYNEDDFDNDLDLSEEEVYPVKSSEKTSYQEEYYVGDTRAIDLVLDHRPIAEGPDNGTNDPRKDLEYYIKWQGISHLHNTWETYEDLSVLKGNKRLDNYIRQNVILDSQIRSDPSTSREDIEAMDLERERLRENYEEFKTVERVVSSERSNADGKKKLRYLVKWKRLYYDACTWEDAEYVAKIAPRAVEQFLARSNSKLLPSNSVNYGARRPRFEKLTEQPSYVKNGELRDFQLTGLNWMAFLWSRNENGILADEMGLGKTVQTIAFLSWLVYARKQHGPFLVVVPLSTVPAWQETIDLWAPDLNYIVYLGNTESRRVMRTHEFYVDGNKKKPKFNILLTTYEYILKDRSELGSIKWRFLAVDEAHRLKNSESALYESLQEFKVENRLLITGTPLQNNIRELAALIDFLMPGKINIDLEIDFESPGANQEVYIRDLHEQLKPFILRRLKKDVEKSLPSKSERILRVELSDMQTEYYKNIISRNYSALNAGATGSSQLSLLNIMMELKKASNHPYLFPNAENQFLSSLDGDHSNERIFRGMIMNSGKMVLLDKLLGRLRRDGHRVLIFSQMVRMLDILGDYLTQRGLPFQRLDGTIPAQTRRIAIDHFNAPGSPDFVFLLSTRAGGLGINLMTADTVIIFDSDWNPQADLQAMARAHRIGQKSHVMVYRFVSKDTVEEEVLERARRKMILEYAIISLGITDKSGASKKTEPTSKELSAILKFGAGNMFKANENQKKLENMNLDDVLEHAEDHETQPDLGESHLGGEEFLKQFEVTDYKADVDWDDIIPAGDLAKIKEEDRKRQEEEYLQEQINLSSRRKVTMRQLSNDNDSEDSSSQRENRRKERAIKRKHETDGAGDPNSLTERDIRGIYKSILRYGNLRERWHQIVADGSFSNKEPERIKEVFDEMTELSKEAIARQEARRVEMEKNLPPSEVGKKKERKAVLFEYKGLVKNLNAELILQRPQDLKILDDAIPKEDPLTFKLKGHVKSVHGWNCSWELKDDEMLLVGVFKYGYGAWASIRDDPTLGLSDKFFLEEHRIEKKEERVKEEKSGPKMPGPVHLGRRVEYLISLLKEPEPRDAEKDSRRRKRLATKTGKVNSGSASASPAPPAGIKGENAKATESSHDHSAPANGSSAPPRAKTAKAERPKKVSGSLPPLSAHRREKVEKVEKVERNGDESDYPSMDEQSCKDMLHPVRQSLRRLRKGGAGIDRAEWADILKRELTSVGDHIHRKVSSAPRDEQDKLYKHLWVFASYFWPAKVSSRKIAEMYSKLRKQRQAAASEQKNGTAVKQENRPVARSSASVLLCSSIARTPLAHVPVPPMSSIFQAITRPADDFLEVGSSLFSSNTKTVHPGRRIRLIDRTADDDETEPLIPPSHADTAGAALARRQVARKHAQQDIAEEPNAPPIVRNAESRESEGPEVSTAADRGTDGPSSSSAAEEDPTMALTSDVAAEETSDETAPLLRRENDDDDDGYGQPADSVARKRFNKRSCTVRLEHTVLRIISCLFFCCPTSFEGIDEEGEYMIGDEGDIIPVIPSRFTRHGYEQLKEEQKMVKARNGIFSADPNIAYDVLYENQRGLFMFGQPFFSSQGLLQVDPPAWVDADFRYSPFDILSTPLPDPSWEWVWRTWYIDMTYDVDDQGWSYSFTFPSRSWHGSHVWFHGFVRRRRWIRKRRRVKDDGSEEEYPTALGIRDHNKARKAYSIVEGTTLNYFSVESSAVRARADHERRKHVQRNLTALPAVSEDGGKVDSAQGDDNIDLDYWFSDDEEDDGGSTERTFTIGALMRRLKKVRLDREKIDAVERFVCLGKDDIVLLAPFMDRIVSYLIFQQSRRELLRSLLFYYKQIRAQTRLLRTGKKESEDDFETNSHALSHANHATLQLESMSLDELKLRRKALHQAIVLARQEVMKLDFYSDRKMSNKEYAKADLMGDSYGSTYNTPQMAASYKSSMSIQERILEETLEDVEAEELLEEDEVETPEEAGKEPEEAVENDDDGDTGTLVPQTSNTSSQKDKGKTPEYRMPILSRTSEYEARTDENKDPKDSDRESTISAVRNKVLSFVSGS